MKNTSLILAIAGIAALLYFLVRLGSAGPAAVPQNGGQQATRAAGTLAAEVTDEDHIKGNKDAAITIVEYSDFQCPACAAYEPVVSQVLEELGEDARFVYRHFPLRQVHPNAQLAAQAAEAAAMQGAFYAMHDELFATQRSWSNLEDPSTFFSDLAAKLELDTKQFTNDINSQEARNAVNEDFQSGSQSAVRGTPSFYVNGQKITNPQSVDAFVQVARSIAAQ